jgi:acetamidase/formamidase
MATHHLDDTQTHAFWDNSYPARLRIQPGDTVVFETREGSDMIDHLTSEYNMTREQAYCLCSAAVDLKISEIVNSNWVVSAYLPLSIFK